MFDARSRQIVCCKTLVGTAHSEDRKLNKQSADLGKQRIHESVMRRTFYDAKYAQTKNPNFGEPSLNGNRLACTTSLGTLERRHVFCTCESVSQRSSVTIEAVLAHLQRCEVCASNPRGFESQGR